MRIRKHIYWSSALTNLNCFKLSTAHNLKLMELWCSFKLVLLTLDWWQIRFDIFRAIISCADGKVMKATKEEKLVGKLNITGCEPNGWSNFVKHNSIGFYI